MTALVCAAALLLICSAPVEPCSAQDYPSRPVRAIVAVGSGGTADIFTRVLGEELFKRWWHPLVVENRSNPSSIPGGIRALSHGEPDDLRAGGQGGRPAAAVAMLACPRPAMRS
ncbi:MAG TPA: hypothetical protein VGF60_00535 [Xanthobacteraceae bacterium]|jgi:tripartite-type tricarboxylate transporter receptor subunit TctC